MKNKKTNSPSVAFSVARYLAFCAIIVGIVLLCICHTGCQITSEGIKVLDAAESPEIASVRLLNENSLEVQFTKPITVKTAVVSKLQQGQDASLEILDQDVDTADGILSTDGKTVVYKFPQKTIAGQRYLLFSEITDERGNTLTFALPFDGYNSRIPVVVMTEVQKKAYTTVSKTKNFESPYVTIRALQDGNLAGLELYSASQKASYPLPMVEVKKGEFITLHLKPTKNLEHCVSELDDDLNLAKTGNATPENRDLYFLDGKGIGATADLILIRERNTNTIIDALSYFSDGTATWKFESEIVKAISCGAWEGAPSKESALDITNCGTSAPFKRISIPTLETKKAASKNDWTFTPKSK